MIKVLIQVEAGSRDKNFYNEKTLEFRETRRGSHPYPYPYGFVLGTKAEDGDAVDCYLITKNSLKAGAIVECEVIGLLEQDEDGEVDHKILAALPGQSVELNEVLLKELQDFIHTLFSQYPNMHVSVGPLRPREAALHHILRSRKEGDMDQSDNRARPYALKADEGWTYRYGVDFILKAGEIQEGSGATFLEYLTRKGEEPPSHTHKTEDEMFYVLEGEVTFQCGEETFDVNQGGFIFLPRGIRHGYTIRSEGPVRLIVVTSPVRDGLSGGWGGLVSDMELGQGELIAKPKHET